MAFDSAELSVVGYANGYTHYRYDTLDTHATVDTSGYFNNSDDTVNLSVGDIIEVVVWSTATRSGTVSTYGPHIVLSVSAAGVVDVGDVTVMTVTDTD